MGFLNKNQEGIKMTCRSSKKGEVLCQGSMGDRKATVLGKMGQDGHFRIENFDGDMEIVHKIEEEMLERTKGEIKSSAGLGDE